MLRESVCICVFLCVCVCLCVCVSQKAADVWKKDVGDFQAFSKTLLELRFSLGNEGKDGKNLNSQTWLGTPRRPSPRHRLEVKEGERLDASSKSTMEKIIV